MDSLFHTSLPCVFAGAFHGTAMLTAAPDTVVFAYSQRGQLQLDTAPGTLLCPEGSYLYWNARQDLSLSADCDFLVLVRAAIPENTELSTFPGVYTDEEAANLLDKIGTCSDRAGDAARLALSGTVSMLLARHIELALPDSTDKARISAGVRLLTHDFLKNDPISRYADACRMGENRFRTLFARVYSCSPVDYRNRLRLLRAQDLIRLFGLPTGTAAAACGFNSASYFCRLYKKVFGINPTGGDDTDGTPG